MIPGAATSKVAASVPPSLVLRGATPEDAAEVADIWYEGWCDAHIGGVPEELVAVRTRESFKVRAAARVQDTTVARLNSAVAGFVMVVADEVEQLYVGRAHRGSGIAQQLLAAAEGQIARNGYTEAWLAVVPTNARARAFYARCGWIDRGRFDHDAPTETGPIRVPAHRYTKRLSEDHVR